MTNNYRWQVMLFFCLPWLTTRAQADPMAAVQKIITAYHPAKAIRFTGTMTLYAKNDPGKVLESVNSSFLLQEEKFYCSIGPVEMLRNNAYYVSADNANKQIMIGRPKDLPANKQMPVLNMGRLAALLKEKKITIVPFGSGMQAGLQIADRQCLTGYNGYTIVYDAGTGYIEKAAVETDAYKKATGKTLVLEVSYTKPVVVRKTKNVFSERLFFFGSGKVVQLMARYKDYRLVIRL